MPDSRKAEGPFYKHDCDECEFIGTVNIDIYRCPQNGIPTWIARYGSGGPQYTSHPESVLFSFESIGNPYYALLMKHALDYRDKR